MEVRWVGGVADRVRVLCIVMVHEGPICDGILGRVRMMVWSDRVLSFEALLKLSLKSSVSSCRTRRAIST